MEIPVIVDEVLGVKVARGFADISLLSKISKADIFDAKTNPSGTQRDLSVKHAREAYEYVLRSELAYLPEVFLCVRKPSAIKLSSNDEGVSTLSLNETRLENSNEILISRVDGNHRLFYADGHNDRYPAINKTISFCIAIGLSREEEIRIFKDINDNQKKMNTSHLDNITIRLTPANELKQDRELYIANALADDKDSPFYELVYKGGKKDTQRFMALRALKSGIKYLFSESTKLSAIGDIDAQLVLIKNYFWALREVHKAAWETPRKFLILRGAGFWGACFLGADIIDRAIMNGSFRRSDMKKILGSGRTWNWANDGDFRGLSGRGGALRIKDMIVSEFEEEGKVSIKDLVSQINSEKSSKN